MPCNGLNLWEFAEPVAGILTLITTSFIFYFQAYKRWEDSLEKRLTVFYIYQSEEGEIEVARVINAYLAHSDDIRAWAQSLGAQIFGSLDFDMYWGNIRNETMCEDKQWYKDYTAKIFLTRNPFEDPEIVETKIKAFLARKFRHSTIEGNINNPPVIWKRKRKPN